MYSMLLMAESVLEQLKCTLLPLTATRHHFQHCQTGFEINHRNNVDSSLFNTIFSGKQSKIHFETQNVVKPGFAFLVSGSFQYGTFSRK